MIPPSMLSGASAALGGSNMGTLPNMSPLAYSGSNMGLDPYTQQAALSMMGGNPSTPVVNQYVVGNTNGAQGGVQYINGVPFTADQIKTVNDWVKQNAASMTQMQQQQQQQTSPSQTAPAEKPSFLEGLMNNPIVSSLLTTALSNMAEKRAKKEQQQEGDT